LSDVAFIGGYWGYKASNINRFLLPLCHPSSGLKVRIYGNQHWPVQQYVGLAAEEDVKDIFASALVCPNVSEPHSTEYGFDVVERPFKVALAGGFCISDHVDSLVQDVFKHGEVLTASTPEDFRERIHHFVKHPEERLPYIEDAREAVLRGHTYWHRVATMLQALGLDAEANATIARYKQTHGKGVN
jgi:spore maturation protein CgeB